MNCVIEYDVLNRCHKVAIFQDREDGTTDAITLTLVKHTFRESEPMPYTSFDVGQGAEILKALAAGLQGAGFLPRTEWKGEGELLATKIHMKDLQRVFNAHIAGLEAQVRNLGG